MGRFDDLDLTKVPSLSPLPDGVYIGTIRSQEVRMSKSQNEKIMWSVDIEEPIEASEKVPKFYFDTSLVPAALFHLVNLAKAAGTYGEGPFDPEALIGQRIGLVIAFENTAEWGARSKVQAFVKADLATAGMKGKWEDVEEGATPAETPAAAGTF